MKERRSHTLPEVAGDDNEHTDSINHRSFNGMQPCKQGKKADLGIKRKQRKNIHHISGTLVIICLHVTWSWRSMERVQHESMLENVKNTVPYGGRKSQHHSPPGKEKEIRSPTSLALLWVSDWTKWPPLVSLNRHVSDANIFLVKLWNYAFKPVFCWYHSSVWFVVVVFYFYPQRKVSLAIFCQNTFWHMVATWKYIVTVKTGDCLNIFVSSLGISEEKLSLTGISSFLNAMKKFYFGTKINTVQLQSWSSYFFSLW